METTFLTKEGKILFGKIINTYKAFEGGTRYIIVCDGKEYRCERKKNGSYVEVVI